MRAEEEALVMMSGDSLSDLFSAYDFVAKGIGTEVFRYNNRSVYKTYADKSYVAYFYLSSGNWFAPLFIGFTPEATCYRMYNSQLGYNVTTNSINASRRGTVEFMDRTWYFCFMNIGSYTNAGVTTISRYNLGFLNEGEVKVAVKNVLDICKRDIEKDIEGGLI